MATAAPASAQIKALLRKNLPLVIFTPLFALLVILATWHNSDQTRYLSQLLLSSLTTGPVAALSGVGLVLTYRATGVFNFAQGGIATVAAYVFYELSSRNGINTAVAGAVAVLVFCPALALVMERVVFRPLEARAASTSEKLVANLGVLVMLIGIPTAIFGQSIQNDVKSLLPATQFSIFGDQLSVGGAEVSTQYAGNLIAVVAVAVGLTLLFRFTKLGLQVRAVVDRRTLAELNAVNANRVSAIAWILGCSFAGMTGILYLPISGLNPFFLTLFVLETIAVAAIARLRSIPLAVFGGLFIAIVQSLLPVFQNPKWPHALTWLQPPDLSADIQTNLLVITLVAVLLIYKNLDEVGSVGGSGSLVTFAVQRPGKSSAIVPGIGVVVAALMPALLAGGGIDTFTLMVGYAIAFLGIVAITGFSGHISLATVAFAGLGAYISARLSNGYLPDIPFIPMPTDDVLPHIPVILSTLLGGLLVVPLGIIVGYPALRRKGLILGLITLAFAQLADRFVFNNSDAVSHGTRPIRRPGLFGVSFSSDTAFAYYALVVLGLCLLLTRNLRSGSLGRALAAMRDSENGAVSVGISLRRYKLFIFGASAFLGGVGGAIISQSSQSLSYDDQTFNPLYGLFWFTAVVVAGLSYPSGAILASVLFVGLDKLLGTEGLGTGIIGFLALLVGFFPGGIVGQLIRLFRSQDVEATPGTASGGIITRRLQAAYTGYAVEQAYRRKLLAGDPTAVDPRTGAAPPSYVASPEAIRILTGRR